MDDEYLDWKPDKVKLESELMLEDDIGMDADFKAPYRETSQNASYGTSIEQKSGISERLELNLACGLPSIPNPISSTGPGVTNGAVKIKEEIMEDLIPYAEFSLNRSQLLPEGNLILPDDLIRPKVEDNVMEEYDVSKTNRQLDLAKANQENEVSLETCSKRHEIQSFISPADNISSETGCEPARLVAPTDVLSRLLPDQNSPLSKYLKVSEYSLVRNFLSKPCPRLKVSQVPKKPKPFSCKECSATFAKKRGLERHLVVHSKKNKFSCSKCSVSFLRKASLTLHVRGHSKEKEFVCNDCSDRFRRKSDLKEHLKKYHPTIGVFSCEVCSTIFSRNSDLKKHQKYHFHYFCDYCPSRFIEKDKLKEHLISAHYSEEEESSDLETSQNAKYETPQAPLSIPSIPKPRVSSTNQEATNWTVKIKEEMDENLTPFSESSLNRSRDFLPGTDSSPVPEESSTLSQHVINSTIEDNLAEENHVSKNRSGNPRVLQRISVADCERMIEMTCSKQSKSKSTVRASADNVPSKERKLAR